MREPEDERDRFDEVPLDERDDDPPERPDARVPPDAPVFDELVDRLPPAFALLADDLPPAADEDRPLDAALVVVDFARDEPPPDDLVDEVLRDAGVPFFEEDEPLFAAPVREVEPDVVDDADFRDAAPLLLDVPLFDAPAFEMLDALLDVPLFDDVDPLFDDVLLDDPLFDELLFEPDDPDLADFTELLLPLDPPLFDVVDLVGINILPEWK